MVAILDTVLCDAEYLLLSDAYPQLFDARYFGLITRNQIQHVVNTVFTWSFILREPTHE